MAVKSRSKSIKSTQSVRIDYPRPEEHLVGESYAIRVQSDVEGPVEVSMDDGPWKECRPGVGFWWYDWNPLTKKAESPSRTRKHKLVARARGGNGTPIVSPARRFRFEVEQPA